MSSSLLLSVPGWDLTLDANNNIAFVGEPYSLAQDAASAIQTYLAEMWWDTTQGVPYLQQVFGGTPPPLPLMKQLLVNAALSANSDIASAQVFFTAFSPANRQLAGQVQILSVTGQVAAANFSTSQIQGIG